MSYAFIAAFVIMLASLSGAVFAWHSAGHWIEKNLRYLVTFSAGVFVIVSYGLFTESIELGGSGILIALSAIAGAAFLEIAGRLIPDSHHHHGTHAHKHSRTDARRLLMGDAIHNTIDGFLLVPAFLIDIRVGIVATAAIFFHEVVQEISEFFVLKEAGYSTTRALTLNFIVSSTILVGVAVGMFVSTSTLFVPLVIAFAAGAFLYVVFRDLLPSTFRSVAYSKNGGAHLIAGVLGIIVMFSISVIAPAHSDEVHMEEDFHEEAL